MSTHGKYPEPDYDIELVEELQRVNNKLRLGVEEVFDEIHHAYREGELEKARLKKELLLGRASLAEAYTRLGEEALRLNALHKALEKKSKAKEDPLKTGGYVSESDARLVQYYLKRQRERKEREQTPEGREKRRQQIAAITADARDYLGLPPLPQNDSGVPETADSS